MSKIKDLEQHDKNANEGTEYGDQILERSIEKYKIGKSIVIDKNNKIVAGNHVTGKLAEMGMEEVHIVESEGDIGIAVMRMDIDIDTKEGQMAAIADNRSSELNLAWNTEMLEKEYGSAIMSKFHLQSEQEDETDWDDEEQWTENLNSIKLIKLKYDAAKFRQITKALEIAKAKSGAETNTQIFRKLVTEKFTALFPEDEEE